MIPNGLCQCGCGQRTQICTRNRTNPSLTKGQFYRFVQRHGNRRQDRHDEDYEVRDCGYKTPCHVWKLKPDPKGYGMIGLNHTTRRAHRYLWERIHGPVPKGYELDHLCRNRLCVNPDHLEAVTHAVNMQRGSQARLTAANVREIRLSRGVPDDVFATRFHVSWQTIQKVRLGETWRQVEPMKGENNAYLKNSRKATRRSA